MRGNFAILRLGKRGLKPPTAYALGILVTLFLCSRDFASDQVVDFSLDSPAGVSATIALGLDNAAGLFTIQQAGNVTTYSDGNYQVQISSTPSQARTIVRVVVTRVSGEAFRLNEFSITARAPSTSIAGIWYPGAEASSTNVMVTDASHSIDDISDANYGIPYVGASSFLSKNVFAMGFGRQDLAVLIHGAPNGTDYDFRLTATAGRTTARFDESFYFSTDSSMTWSDVAANYSDWVDAITNYQPFPVSARAYEPLYDAWYWAGDRVDERLYIDTARLASEAGIGLYLADSGWDTEAGEYEKWLSGKTGDYTPPATKFDNLSETFNEMRAGNLGIDLWLQPFAVGRESMRYAATQDMHIQLPSHIRPDMGWRGLTEEPFVLPLGDNLENVNLCPRLASTQRYLRNLFGEVAAQYKPEGYWIDFIDGMPSFCIAPHAHTYATFGEGLRQSLQTIKQTILEHDPRAIVHFRMRYANLNTKPFANVWQSGDSPGDYDRMRLSSIRLRPFSKGVVFAADELYWPDGISEVQVSKFIMTSVMVGVPSLGPSLLFSPPSTLEMIKAWMAFYRANQVAIATGRFSTFGQLAVPNHKIESPERTFAYIRTLAFSEVPAEGRTIYLMNATGVDRFFGRVRARGGVRSYAVKVFNRYLSPEPGEMQAEVDSRGFLNLNVAVQQGGMVQLEPIEP